MRRFSRRSSVRTPWHRWSWWRRSVRICSRAGSAHERRSELYDSSWHMSSINMYHLYLEIASNTYVGRETSERLHAKIAWIIPLPEKRHSISFGVPRRCPTLYALDPRQRRVMWSGKRALISSLLGRFVPLVRWMVCHKCHGTRASIVPRCSP